MCVIKILRDMRRYMGEIQQPIDKSTLSHTFGGTEWVIVSTEKLETFFCS